MHKGERWSTQRFEDAGLEDGMMQPQAKAGSKEQILP